MLEKIKSYFESISWLSVLVLVILLSPAFFSNFGPVKEKQIVRETTSYFEVIPAKAVTLKEVEVFSDKKLQEKTGTIKEKTQLKIESLEKAGTEKAIFKLSDGTYLSAADEKIGSDVTLTEEKLVTTVYLQGSVKVLYSPFTTFSPEVYQEISGNQSLQTSKKAKTHWGTYYEVSFDGGRTGWIDEKSISLESSKYIALEQVLSEKYGKNENLSITVKGIDNDLTATVNSEKMVYSASLWKIPILYWTQKEINAGKANLSDQLKYISEVNDSSRDAFIPNGTGSLSKTADNKDYSLFDLINRTAKESDNVASNILAYYETDMFSKDFQEEINNLAKSEWSPKSRNANSTMVANVLEALYQEGGASFNALFDTSYDNSRIAAGLPENIRVAHKIGLTDEENHDAAVVFGSQPYILVVMTTNNQPLSLISDISKTVYEALK